MNTSIYWGSFASEQEIDSSRQAFDLALSLVDYPCRQDMVNEINRCIHYTVQLVNHFRSDRSFDQWYNAASNHKDRVAELNAEIIEASRIHGASNPIVTINRSKMQIIDGSDIQEEEIHPRSFWRLYKLYYFVEYCENTRQLIAVLECIASVFLL